LKFRRTRECGIASAESRECQNKNYSVKHFYITFS
jgi:hypothetical protein